MLYLAPSPDPFRALTKPSSRPTPGTRLTAGSSTGRPALTAAEGETEILDAAEADIVRALPTTAEAHE